MSLEVNIRKSFSSFTLDVAFEAGDETLGFLGASGCGKSLTMRCIAGIETPDEGRIVVNDRVFFDSERKINLTPQQQQRVALARILASEPQAILLDEPFSALDSYLKWELELGELLGAFDGPILWVSHELGGSGTPFRILRIIPDAGHAVFLLQPEGAAEGSPVLRAECDAAGTYAAGQALPVSFREEKLLFF